MAGSDAIHGTNIVDSGGYGIATAPQAHIRQPSPNFDTARGGDRVVGGRTMGSAKLT